MEIAPVDDHEVSAVCYLSVRIWALHTHILFGNNLHMIVP